VVRLLPFRITSVVFSMVGIDTFSAPMPHTLRFSEVRSRLCLHAPRTDFNTDFCFRNLNHYEPLTLKHKNGCPYDRTFLPWQCHSSSRARSRIASTPVPPP